MPRRDEYEDEEVAPIRKSEKKEEPQVQVISTEELLHMKLDRIIYLLENQR